ncbi:Fc receptor-like protein 5 isoform X3 [Salmo trutta]|uniref:Fc receptor-like protein 5 isoform X3 n=1 Tax=Salmo trutta TaxID=8032 RepID=UPI0011306C4E|nr:Fc receptor-like protein 5 isoform X3 [Salmo trutta]
MERTCLLLLLLSTLVYCSLGQGGASLSVRPDRSQFFKYESVSLSCEVQGNSAGWRLKRYTVSGERSDCGRKWGKPQGSSCIVSLIPSHSGVYWCESGSGEHSNAVNITVPAGAVILESPALPVTEGDSVTLRCRYQGTPSDLTAVFYKDGSLIRAESSGEMTIPAVSKSDEGLYKCTNSKGDSPESWMTVTVLLRTLVYCSLGQGGASLSVSPDRSQFFEYESVSLSCEVQGNSAGWRVKRYTVSGERSDCGRKWGKQQGSSCIVSLIPSDSGVYWCQSGSGEHSNAVNITVPAGAVILESPAILVTEGDSVTLRCRYQGSPSDLTADFYKDGSLIRTQTTGEMTIPAVSKSDEGLYKCTNSEGESPESWMTVTDLSFPASLSVSPDRSQFFEYESVSLSCEVQGNSARWRVVRNTTRGILSECNTDWGKQQGSSCIVSLTPSDNGVYWCVSGSGEHSNAVNITVPVLSNPASLSVSPDRSQFFKYESVSLSCEVQGNSAGWRLKRHTVSGERSDCGRKWGKPQGSSCIVSLIPSHSGVYWCQSGSGEHSNAVNITVPAGAVILESPALPVTEGDSVTLRCRYQGTPSNLTVDFYKDGSLIRTETTGEITIPAVSKSDEGLYKCTNSEGESPESWMTVTAGAVILESPALPVTEGDSVTLRCRYQGTPSNLTADFYKDRSFIRTETTGEMTIPAVSKSDEGLYKCSSSKGESPESWMTVTGETRIPRKTHQDQLGDHVEEE